MRTLNLLVAGLFFCCRNPLFVEAATRPEFDITILPFSSEQASEVFDLQLNNRGEVLASIRVLPSGQRAYLWRDGRANAVGGFGGCLNDRGDYVALTNIVAEPPCSLVIGLNQVPPELKTLSVEFIDRSNFGFPIAINNQRYIGGISFHIGRGFLTGGHSVVWRPDNRLVSLVRSEGAGAMNDFPSFVGHKFIANDGFLWENGNVHALRDLVLAKGWVLQQALDLNNKMEVVGTAMRDGVRSFYYWHRGEIKALAPIASTNEFTRDHVKISNLSQVLISSDGQNQIWSDGNLVDIQSLIPSASGLTFQAGYDLNDFGEIAGVGLIRTQSVICILSPSGSSRSGAIAPPENDAFTRAIQLPATNEFVGVWDNRLATRQRFEPINATSKGGKSLWWRWRGERF